MSYQSLYRRYRPNSIKDVVSQQHIMEVLVKSIKKDKISHAYLFCGPRGTGKTSVAKLFAKAVNCTNSDIVACGECDNCLASQNGNHPDIVEIDAASNNGVDEIRSLIERVKYSPISGKYKVYIIDEVHMLSQGAFNALLKTLEEPPKHVIFVLATTEIHKVLPTIISRCQRFDFTRIPNEAIKTRLDFILEQEGVKAEEGVTENIAGLSGGGLRNALTILEQAIVLSEDIITNKQIYESNGLITPDAKKDLFTYLVGNDLEALMSKINEMKSQSIQFDRLAMDFVSGLKDSVILTHTGQKDLIDLNNIVFTHYLTKHLHVSVRLKMIESILNYVEKMKFSQMPEMYFDVAMLELYSLVNNMSEQDSPITINQSTDVTPTTRSNVNLEVKPVNNKVEVSNQEVQSHRVETYKLENNEVLEKENDTDIYTPNQSIQLDLEESDVRLTEEKIEVKSNRPEMVTQEGLLEFMVSADKASRHHDSIRFEEKVKYRNNASWARPSRLLDDYVLVLSGEFFVVVATNNELSVKELLEDRNREALYDFSKELFNEDKIIIPTTNDAFKEAVEMFKIGHRNNSLPNPISREDFLIMKPDMNQSASDASLEKIQSLFGEDLEVVE